MKRVDGAKLEGTDKYHTSVIDRIAVGGIVGLVVGMLLDSAVDDGSTYWLLFGILGGVFVYVLDRCTNGRENN